MSAVALENGVGRQVCETEDRLLLAEPNAALEKSVSYSVAPTAFLMMLCYLILTVAHLFVLPVPASIAMATLAAATCVTCGFIARQGNGILSNYLDSHQVIGVLTLLILINVSMHMLLLEDHLQTTLFALAMVGSGFLMLHSGWFALTIFAYVSTWAVLNWILPTSKNSVHFGYFMSISTFFAISAHTARRQTTLRAETARIESVREQRRMERESRRQQEHLEHVSRLLTLGELVAGISHELNQPLAAISSLATACDIMLEAEDSTENLKASQDVLKDIGIAAVRAGVIIRRLRGLASKSECSRSRVDLNQVVRDAAELMSVDVRYRKGELRLDLAPNIVSVNADEVQMQQVVLNLLQNGFEALEENTISGQVIVETSQSQHTAQVSVADTGPGIPTENPNSVFDAFFTTKEHGMGMGLAICRSILERHGGKITCEHRKQSSGATFRFSLPLMPKSQ